MNKVKHYCQAISGVQLNLILWVFTFFIPKQPKLLLFSSGGGKSYYGNSLRIFEFLDDSEYKCVWITADKKILRMLLSKKKNVVYKYSIYGFWATVRAKFIFIDHDNTDFCHHFIFSYRFPVIQLWHGIAFKNVRLQDKNVRNVQGLWKNIRKYYIKKETSSYKLIISTSETDKKLMRDSFASNHVAITGLPRNDIFYDTEVAASIKSHLSLESFNKVFLYAPTYREDQKVNPFSENFWVSLQEILEKTNTVFLIKKHPADNGLVVPKNFSNIIDVTSMAPDVQPILTATDLLITDYSSIAADFALTKRPIIFYTYDFESYIENCRDFYYDLKEILPGPFVESENQLLQLLIDQTWFQNEEHQHRYSDFINAFHKYQDGNSSERVLKELQLL